MDGENCEVVIRDTSGRSSARQFAISEDFRPTLEWIILAITRDSLRTKSGGGCLRIENTAGFLKIHIQKNLATEISMARRIG